MNAPSTRPPWLDRRLAPAVWAVGLVVFSPLIVVFSWLDGGVSALLPLRPGVAREPLASVFVVRRRAVSRGRAGRAALLAAAGWASQFVGVWWWLSLLALLVGLTVLAQEGLIAQAQSERQRCGEPR